MSLTRPITSSSILHFEDRNILFTTPHILCTLATQEILPVEYVSAVLTYYVKTKGWDAQYVAQLRQHHLWSELPTLKKRTAQAVSE